MSGREDLVLLPGMMCDQRLFAPQIAFFENTYNIVVPTLNAPSISAMAEAALGATEAENLNVVGLSMGGIVAMEMARQAPERITRLALLDTNHLADAPERKPIRDRQIEDARNGALRAVITEEMKPNYLAEQNRGNQSLLDLLIEMAIALGDEVFINQSIALKERGDAIHGLRDFSKPLFIACGAEDTVCTPERHREMAALAGIEAQLIDGAAHITTLEQPHQINALLKAWLDLPIG